MILSGWGRYPRAECHAAHAASREEALAAVEGAASLIARGNGRSYGDASLNPRLTLCLGRCDRLVSFDPGNGRLECEAGALLSDIVELFVPRGWFPAVTPGTKFVTVGGMIAADVHGKNHHRAGSFRNCVERLDLALADGGIVSCSKTENPELFAATCGGMGLTGAILGAQIRLMPIETAYLRRETRRAADLDAVMALFEDSQGSTYTIAWIDCLAKGAALGRSLFQRAEHAGRAELPPRLRDAPLALPHRRPWRVPADCPGFALNRWSVGAFNALYWRAAREGEGFVDLDAFFYPLDALLDWNRLYGRGGFVQYQCAIPKAASRAALEALLTRIGRSGAGSFRSVLKLLGPGEGMLSFPIEGYTLALDFRANRATFALLDALDAIVADHGGRLYLAKDARMSASMLRRGYPELDRFRAARAASDRGGKFSSLLSQRLEL